MPGHQTSEQSPPERVAIVLFNLGGPDSPAAIGPFLRNLFRDPAILRVPFFIRPLLARLIARRRLKPATANYALLGGRSPLLELTTRQARALEAALAGDAGAAKTFIAMRYWHPFSEEAAAAVKEWNPDRILLLPLYPHFSTTTTGSSLSGWHEAAARAGLIKPTTTLCCYPTDPAFIAASAAILSRSLAEARAAHPGLPLRVLFSAHGLPEAIVKAGDPYQAQIEASAAALVAAVPDLPEHRVCYQSRATPQQWLTPATDAEIAQAGADKVGLLVVPVAFVSEHSETLVELDIEYRELAHKAGVPAYLRVPAQGDDPAFIAALAGLVRRSTAPGKCSFIGPETEGGRVCAARHADCPLRSAA